METKADRIRALAATGMPVADIARHLGIRYQHVYNVLKRSGVSPGASSAPPQVTAQQGKPRLPIELLLAAGFRERTAWEQGEDGRLSVPSDLPKQPGLYAFHDGRHALYVGLASMGLSKRIRFYARPGSSQRTSMRIGALIGEALALGQTVGLLTMEPPHGIWNGLPIHTAAGVELGLIQTYSLDWNIRSAG
ncbi:hypothetical protein ATO6_13710 [Oceanicola sp. 22II-s10i]|uniref:hypothetical protein n=1 Tax=Oceanicola sp. 22II-s10i TaxID=1317116 RepID=UPI000B52665E|nr:hypothetical protein [Oceanicola sp. 22II-s10i]OWU84118.1 hypothetical protein ATO6_13710 [Oceanicola sp. 22II-s10i]